MDRIRIVWDDLTVKDLKQLSRFKARTTHNDLKLDAFFASDAMQSKLSNQPCCVAYDSLIRFIIAQSYPYGNW